MQGYNDPYHRPREQGRGQGYGRDDDRYGSGGRGYGGGHVSRDRYDDRGGYGGGGGGGRGRGWDDERESKRGRYDDYERGRGDAHSPYPQYGGYPPQQPYSAPPPYAQPGYPDQYGHQPSATGEAAPTGRKPPVKPEAPSASVILLGLPEHVRDVHLQSFLVSMGASIESVTVIMDRTTNTSKRFGFAKFSSVEHARAFIDPNFPSIPWREPGGPSKDDGMRIKINFSQKTGGWREDQGASARLMEDQRRGEGASQGFYVNDGTRDIGSAPSQILLLRGLDPLTNEEDIATALARVGGRANQEIARGGLQKVYLAKDRGSRSSWGFAFVRFANVRLATDVLGAMLNPAFHRAGFRIRNAVVSASFSHENSFTPVYAASAWSFDGEGGQRLAYWDDKGFVQPWTPPPPVAMTNVPKAPRAQEEAKIDADMAAFFDSLADDMPAEPAAEATSATAASAEPVVAAPPTIASSSAPSSSTTPSAPFQPPSQPPSAALPAPGSVAPISIKPITALPGASATPVKIKDDSPPKSTASPASAASAAGTAATAAPLGAKEKKGDLIVSRKAAGSIAKWNTKAKELRSTPAAAAAPADKAAAPPVPASAASQPQTPSTAPSPAPSTSTASSSTAVAHDDPEFEHADPVSFQCLLCQRQFKGDNLANPDTVAASSKRKAANIKKHAASSASPAPSSAASDATKPKYVDRAAARREALGQSDHPEDGRGGKKKKFDGPEAPKPVEQPNKDGLEESNAGRKMLEKMGWNAGAGLGASGSGRVDPVQAAQFQKGAGLGATKGVAVGSEESQTYTEKLRAKALERYNAS
ncbi:hypothetical protein JCM8097_009543 [Rhodosporidiobolus ruineniae]